MPVDVIMGASVPIGYYPEAAGNDQAMLFQQGETKGDLISTHPLEAQAGYVAARAEAMSKVTCNNRLSAKKSAAVSNLL